MTLEAGREEDASDEQLSRRATIGNNGTIVWGMTIGHHAFAGAGAMNMARFFGRCANFAGRVIRDPYEAWRWVRRRFFPYVAIDPGVVVGKRSRTGPWIAHVGAFARCRGNAGDILLPPTLRSLFQDVLGPLRWKTIHCHQFVSDQFVSDKVVKRINATQGVVIGGGGLFLKDTAPNLNSGWQWNCSLAGLAAIRAPLAVFAVGYNRFRGQEEFTPVFREHVLATVRKAVFFGLRNRGSVARVRSYLPEELHSKVRFQPCMTTVLKHVYPQLFTEPVSGEPFIALNCAFDREELRFGEKREEALTAIAAAAKRLSYIMPIRYYSHQKRDELMLPHLEQSSVPYRLVRLDRMDARGIVEAYRKPALVIGMRGHSQMIPFGCGVPILSLVSHDKMQWFLEDIRAPEWGLEVQDPELCDKLYVAACSILEEANGVRERIAQAQRELWEISRSNTAMIGEAFGVGPSGGQAGS